MYKIEKFDHEGRGITNLNGKIIFVEKAIPEEIVDIKIINEKEKYSIAKIKKIIKPSINRAEVKCPYYDNCGGCDLLHINYELQLKFKYEKIKNIIERNLGSNIKINDIIKCNNNYNYRNKVTFHVKNDIGFFNKQSNKLVSINNCLCVNKLINNEIKNFKKLNLKEINEIICKAGNGKIMIIINTNNPDIDITPIKHISVIYIKYKNRYILKTENDSIYQNLDKYIYKISPDSFFQVNPEIAVSLYNKIKNYVGTNKNIVDLYCGTGSIGIFISEGNNVLGIEVNNNAIMDAKKNKIINNINNIDFICSDSSEIIKYKNFNPDIIIVDPPRNGLNKETINNILEIYSNTIIYVSCNPTTLVRDLKILNKNYAIKEITPFDMFPNTKHCECIACLEKTAKII